MTVKTAYCHCCHSHGHLTPPSCRCRVGSVATLRGLNPAAGTTENPVTSAAKPRNPESQQRRSVALLGGSASGLRGFAVEATNGNR
jgi:hypothetical protein